MILPTPEAPFSRIKFVGESVTVDVSGNVIVFPTGHRYLLKNNEYTLLPDHPINETGVHTISAKELDALKYQWIAVYDKELNYADVFIFSKQPQRVDFLVENHSIYGSYLTSDGKYYLTSDGKIYSWMNLEKRITQLVLYPGNGVIYHRRHVYPNFAQDSKSTNVPDALNKDIEGSITKFLKPYASGTMGYSQFLTYDGDEYLDCGGKVVFTKKQPGANTTITVSENLVLREIPPDFVGLTTDLSTIQTFIKLAQTTDIPQNLFSNLGISNLRIQGWDAGNSETWSTDENLEFLTNKANRYLVDTLYDILNPTNWTISWMVNLENYNPELCADEANYVYSKFGSKLIGIEIGNEPDLYVWRKTRAVGYNVSQYLAEWESYVTAIKNLNSDIPICAPSSAYTPWLHDFSYSDHSDIAFLNQHFYPTVREGGNAYETPTAGNLLSRSVRDRTKSNIHTWVEYANYQNIPFVIGETNSCALSGKFGLSNTMASALWAIDYIFIALESGARRMNFQGAYLSEENNFWYAPIRSDGTAMPLYYGILFFRHFTKNGGNLVSSTIDTSINVVSYSTIDSDNSLHVHIVNKDLYNDAIINLNTYNFYTDAEVIELKSNSITSTTGIKFCGSGIANDGSWTQTVSKRITVSDNQTTLTVPAFSAVIVTFS